MIISPSDSPPSKPLIITRLSVKTTLGRVIRINASFCRFEHVFLALEKGSGDRPFTSAKQHARKSKPIPEHSQVSEGW